MDIKQRIHGAMKIVKKEYDWSNETLFNFIMGQFATGNGHLRHNKDRHSYITIMLYQAESSLISLLRGIKKK